MERTQFLTNKKIVLILASLCCILWGSAFPGVKSGYELFNINSNDIASKLVFAGYRFFLAGILVLIIALFNKKSINIFKKDQFTKIVILGITQTTLQYIFFYIGLTYVTGTKGSIIAGTGAFFSVILAHYIYKNDKLNMQKILGCIIGFLGIVIINFDKELLTLSFNLKGEGLLILSAFTLSAASIYGKKITQVLDSIVVTGYQLFIGGLVLIVLGYMFNGNISGFNFKSTTLLIYLAVLSAVAFSLWTVLLKYNKVSEVTIYNFLTPIFGAILSAIFLGENIFEFKNAIALCTVSIGIWLVNREYKEEDLTT